MKEIKKGTAVLYREWTDIHRPPTWDTYVGLVIEVINYYDDMKRKTMKKLYIVLINGELKQCYPSEIEIF